MNVYQLEIKSVTTDGVVKLEGLGVVFGSVDRVGEFFTEDTDFWTEAQPQQIPVLWEHGADPAVGRRVLGFVDEMRKTSLGLSVRLVLDKAGDLAGDIVRKVQDGLLGLSSGSVSHLVQRAGAQIVSWPIFELSLTEHPAEPLTMSLQQVKSLQLLDWRIRDIQRQMIVHQCWENVGRFRDPETKRWFELLADIIELEGEIERDKRMADLQRAGRLTKRLRELEAQ